MGRASRGLLLCPLEPTDRGVMGVTTYADITPLEPEWEIPDLVPKSFVTLIIGDGGVGKGNLWSDWAGRITRGARLPRVPDEDEPESPGSVLLVTSEDDPNMTTAWRLRAAQARLSCVFDMTEDFEIPGSLPGLAERIDEIPRTQDHVPGCSGRACKCPNYPPVRMVVIDPLADNLGTVPGTRRQISLTSGNVTLRKYVMRPLEHLARSKGISLVVIHHTVKSGRMAGSKGISDAARMVLRITRPDETQPLRLISVEKTNIAGGDDSVGYTISGDWPDVHVSYVDAPADDTATKRPPTIADTVLDVLGRATGPLATRDVASRAGEDYGAVRVALSRLKRAGEAIQPSRGLWDVPRDTVGLEAVK